MATRKLTRDLRIAAKINEDGSEASPGFTISAKDKKWEQKLNDAGLSAKHLKKLEEKGVIVAEGDEDQDEGSEAPDATATPVHDLQVVLDGIDDAAEIKKLRRKDKRVSARPLYDARLEALAATKEAKEE